MTRETSMTAYINEIAPTLGARQIAVLEIFENSIERDFTNTELRSRLGWEINTVTPRVNELRKYGILVDSGVRQCSVTGRRVHAWKLREAPAVSSKMIPSTPTFYQQPSRSNPSQRHFLKETAGALVCSCRGYYYRKTCSHVKALAQKRQDPRDSMQPLFK